MPKVQRLLACALLLTASAYAQTNAPGLWAIQSKMGGDPEMEKARANMQKQLAAMPAAQRKQMEAMMGQSGMGVSADGGVSLKVCITPDMVARAELPTQTQGDCTHTITSRSASSMKMKFVCTKPPSSGEGTYLFQGDKAYTMNMVMRSVENGKPQTLTIDAKGQWLGADCGSVKPIKLPQAAAK